MVNKGGSLSLPKGYKQTEIGVIPEDWEVKTLGEVVVYQKGYPFKSKDYKSDGVRVIRISDTTYNSIKSEKDAIFVSKDIAKITENWALKKGDLILTTVGSKPPMYDSMVGKVIYVKEKFAGSLLNQNAVSFKNNSESLQIYLSNIFNTKRYVFFIETIFRGNANQASITLTELFDFQIPLPPLPEQEAIAAALSDADAYIENLENIIAKKRLIKQGTMQELLTPPSSSHPELVEGWEVKKLGEVCESYSGGTPNTSIDSFYNGEINFIGSGDLNQNRIKKVEGRISKSGLDNSSAKMVSKGTLLIAMYGATAGVVAITTVNGAINQAILAVIPVVNYSSEFLYYFFSLKKDWIIKTYTQGGQPNLSGGILKAIEISFPSLPEQERIATILSDMDAELEALEAQLSKAQSLKQGMMQALLTGSVRLV